MRRFVVGLIGTCVALLGLCATITAEKIMRPSPKSAIEVNIAIGNSSLRWPFKRKVDPPPEDRKVLTPERVRNAGVVLAMAALPLAVASFWRGEPRGWGAGIIILASAALALEWFVFALALVLFTGALMLFLPADSFHRRS